jgi:hypothetical protein
VIRLGILLAAFAPACLAQPSMDDFWNGTATFQYVRQQKTPSAGGGPNSAVFYNLTAQITVVGNTWYRISREAIIDKPAPAGCKGEPYARMVLYKSADQGATWTGRTVVVEPMPNSATACANADGAVFYDPETTTWHAVFQCTDNRTLPWGVCHATRRSSDPVGPWVVDPGQSVKRGAILQDLANLTGWFDEGTPNIVEKVGGWFYVTFHGYNGTQGVRVVARTRDFTTWAVDTTVPLFGPADCASWNVAWKGGCIGSGWADTLVDGGWYYMLIEAADRNLACVPDQNWVIGLVRARNLTSSQWQQLPGGAGILFNSAQPDPKTGRTRACGLQHGLLFRSGADIYLSVMHAFGEYGYTDNDPKSARYYYKLVKGGPVASYTFRYGDPDTAFNLSDSVSRGNLEAKVADIKWLNPGLAMNGASSVVTLPDNPVILRSAPWTLDITFKLDALPATASSFIAGDRKAAWLELYRGGDLCAFGWSATGPQKVCVAVSLNTSINAVLSVTPAALTLAVNGTTIGSARGAGIPRLGSVTVGSSGPDPGGAYGSWKGTLSRLAIYDHATVGAVAR